MNIYTHFILCLPDECFEEQNTQPENNPVKNIEKNNLNNYIIFIYLYNILLIHYLYKVYRYKQ